MTTIRKVHLYLSRKKIAVEKKKLMRVLNLTQNQLDAALRGLKKKGKVGYTLSQWGGFGKPMTRKTYWGIK